MHRGSPGTRLSLMTKSVNVHEAKTHLSKLLDQVQNGEEVVIARAGVPCARLVSTDTGPRPSGMLKGLWPDLELDAPFFDALPDNELEAWER
jgi:prevent-host-death family protein